MSRIIDRRHNSRNKSAVNRHRFLQRFKNQVRKSVSDAVAKRSIADFEHGEKVNIPAKDIKEPIFKHGDGGIREIVLPGNKNFSRGDKIKIPEKQEQDTGSQASDTGSGEDNFVFEISREEFLDIFFDDLALPNMLKKQLAQTKTFSMVRAGFTTEGVPTNINIIRTFRNALGRRLSMRNAQKNKQQKLAAELNELETSSPKDMAAIAELEARIAKLTKRSSNIPFIDPFDLRYNRRVAQPSLSSKAVVFFLMDVSGSMDEAKKDVAKRFFILLYLFLTRTYETIDIVFIRHHTSAKEVKEEEFFYSRETGGTVVSSALELMNEIIVSRYPANEWNIYGAQASDGDNWNNDSPHCKEVLLNYIMPKVQYFAYIEIMPRHHQSLWEEYEQIKAAFPNFAMQNISTLQDIYPVFRDLFKKQHLSETA
jgi:uncharacterized sporulation protein YeaH/YhbH (DUF444 family)